MKKVKLLISAVVITALTTSTILGSVVYADELQGKDQTNKPEIVVKVQEQKNDDEKVVPTLQQAIENTISHYKDNNSIDTFWKVVALSNLGEDINSKAYDLSSFNETAPDDESYAVNDAGFILGLISKGENPKSFNGKNLLDILASKQGDKDKGGFSFYTSNGNIWSIIALEITNTKYDKEFAIDTLLKHQMQDGSFAYAVEYGGDTDNTGMALMAISMIQKDLKFSSDERLKTSVEKALTYLDKVKQADGTFFYDTKDWTKESNANSTAMAICGLLSLGENLKAERWANVDNGILNLQVLEDGTYKDFNGKDCKAYKGQFYYQKSQGQANDLATYQSLLALSELKNEASVWDELKEKYIQMDVVKKEDNLPKEDNTPKQEAVKKEEENKIGENKSLEANKGEDTKVASKKIVAKTTRKTLPKTGGASTLPLAVMGIGSIVTALKIRRK